MEEEEEEEEDGEEEEEEKEEEEEEVCVMIAATSRLPWRVMTMRTMQQTCLRSEQVCCFLLKSTRAL